MKTILKFRRTDVARAIEHTLASKKHSKVYGERKGKPGLVLVHDDGVYLMSSGQPALPADPNDKSEHPRSFVAQAQGTDPKKDPDWHTRSAELVGGDDFAEKLDIESCVKWLAGNEGREWMELEFSDSQIGFVSYQPKEHPATVPA